MVHTRTTNTIQSVVLPVSTAVRAALPSVSHLRVQVQIGRVVVRLRAARIAALVDLLAAAAAVVRIARAIARSARMYVCG